MPRAHKMAMAESSLISVRLEEYSIPRAERTAKTAAPRIGLIAK